MEIKDSAIYTKISKEKKQQLKVRLVTMGTNYTRWINKTIDKLLKSN